MAKMKKLKEKEKSATLGLALTLATNPKKKEFTFKRKFLKKIIEEIVGLIGE